jgi:hypothetical protein
MLGTCKICSLKLGFIITGLYNIELGLGSDPDSTYFIMSVWPVKNPRRAIVAWLYFEVTEIIEMIEIIKI